VSALAGYFALILRAQETSKQVQQRLVFNPETHAIEVVL